MFRYVNNHKYLSPSISTSDYSSRTVSHVQCGDNTKDKRRLIVLKNNNDLIAKANTSTGNWNNVGSTLRRSLIHDLDTTQRGRKKPPKKLTAAIFNQDNIIPISVIKSCWLNVPSVFTKIPVFHQLSVKEILNMKDLPSVMVKLMDRRSFRLGYTSRTF